MRPNLNSEYPIANSFSGSPHFAGAVLSDIITIIIEHTHTHARAPYVAVTARVSRADSDPHQGLSLHVHYTYTYITFIHYNIVTSMTMYVEDVHYRPSIVSRSTRSRKPSFAGPKMARDGRSDESERPTSQVSQRHTVRRPTPRPREFDLLPVNVQRSKSKRPRSGEKCRRNVNFFLKTLGLLFSALDEIRV